MIVRILGSAAGGGVPQWNCACLNCTAARAGTQPCRTQSGVAVSADGARWLLLNCSPDIAQQIEAFAPLQPRALRGTPIDGILLTDANVDHLGGLAVLRQSGDHRFAIRSSRTTRDIALQQPAFAPFARAPHAWASVEFGRECEPIDDCDLVGSALSVRAVDLVGTTPGYAGRQLREGAAVAYEISDRAGGATLLFAPIFAAIDDVLVNAVNRAEVALLDGTFYRDDDLTAARLMPKSARELGHQAVDGIDGTLSRLSGTGARILLTHLNNSNPMLDPSSDAAAQVRSAGAAIAYDGMEFEI